MLNSRDYREGSDGVTGRDSSAVEYAQRGGLYKRKCNAGGLKVGFEEYTAFCRHVQFETEDTADNGRY